MLGKVISLLLSDQVAEQHRLLEAGMKVSLNLHISLSKKTAMERIWGFVWTKLVSN
jgi:hypothetical protein